ncbi:MAG: hypothetical protein AB1918_08905 [Pseudomonadota bacterium]
MAAARRLPLLAAGAASLVAGLLAGEARLGWELPGLALSHLHGPLMVCGFFGTVISLERAAALKSWWGWLAPPLCAAGGLGLILGAEAVGAALLVFGSLVFLSMAVAVLRRQAEPFTLVMAAGAAAWVAGNAAWFHGTAVSQVVPLWASFLVLTIAGERLELSRFLKPWRWRAPLLAPPLALVVVGAALAALEVPLAWTVFGAGLMMLVGWSLVNDVARRTIRQTGLTRYVAVCLLSGYGWLWVAGMLAPQLDAGLAGPVYDATLHALFVGFVFSMVFGHGPIIVPAVIGARVAYGPAFYLPLVVLHGSLAARLAGDLAGIEALRAAGGLANAAAIMMFMATMVTAVALGSRQSSGKVSRTVVPAAFSNSTLPPS